jgi:hypothetical protein
MNGRTKNEPSEYLTRASLAGADAGKPVVKRSANEVAKQLKRNVAGVLDTRWYIQLPRKR